MTVYARPTHNTTTATIPPGRSVTKPATKSTPHNIKTNPSIDRVPGLDTSDGLGIGGWAVVERAYIAGTVPATPVRTLELLTR